MTIRLIPITAVVAILLVPGTLPAEWPEGSRTGLPGTMIITLRDGRETRIPLSDISGVRFEGAVPVAPVSDQIGRVVEVDEGGWRGIWTRIGESNRFRAVWRNSEGQEQRDELLLESVRGDKVVFYRESKKGRYRITLTPDRTQIAHGTADWYRSGDSFSGSLRD